jgi:hypothetical protein|tara:strand:+ start:269 stop:1429 length:1161 start_codon:yes stop_codon:yes gene_type:complete
MKTLQEQYNLIKEGKGHKDVFMKSAKMQFPNLFNNLTDFKTAVKVLKQKSILSEGVGGVVTQKTANPFANWESFLAEETAAGKKDEAIKAVAKEPNKEVVDMETKGYDYKDPKLIDNLYGEAFLQGYYTEMKDPANRDKTVDELKAIVAKNMMDDRTYYATNAQFGIKGIGYTEDTPGLKVSDKPLKGKYASSGMEEVKIKENTMAKLKDLLNETLSGYVDVQPINIPVQEKQGYNDELDDSLGMKHGSKEQDMAQRRADSENMEKADGDRKYSGDKSKDKGRKKIKKETIDSKLSEIEKAGKVTTLEAQIEALDEAITTKNERISMVTEDDNLSELVDKAKMKEMQREVKELEKRKAKMEKLYEKMCGKAYVKTEVVDEADQMDY